MADIYVSYGNDAKQMTVELLRRANTSAYLHEKMRVCIKPNLVVSRPADNGATTHPDIVEGIVLYLREQGIGDIVIAEGSWVGDSTSKAFERCGYNALAAKYDVELVDTKADTVVRHKTAGFELEICKSVADADFLINVPVLKGHCQTGMTCCLKNLKGCIPDSEKRRYHTMGLHRPIAALNTILKPSLNVVDNICGDLNFEEGGNPVYAGRILLGFDALLVDSYCAGLLGFLPEEIEHLRYAGEYGVGQLVDNSTRIDVVGAGKGPAASITRSGAVGRLARHVEEDGACSACYAALIYALEKNGGAHLREKVKIGQGFRDKTCGGVGVGNCAAGCQRFVGGCPPRAVDIAQFLADL